VLSLGLYILNSYFFVFFRNKNSSSGLTDAKVQESKFTEADRKALELRIKELEEFCSKSNEYATGLENGIKFNESRISQLEERNRTLEYDYADETYNHQTMISNLQERIAHLEENLEAEKYDAKLIKDDLESQLQSQKDQISELRGKVEGLEASLEDLRENNEIAKERMNSLIAKLESEQPHPIRWYELSEQERMGALTNAQQALQEASANG